MSCDRLICPLLRGASGGNVGVNDGRFYGIAFILLYIAYTMWKSG